LQERRQTGLSLKSTKLSFSRCYIFVSEITSALIAHYDDTSFWISAGTNKDDIECPIQLKVCFTDSTLEYVCCGFWSWPCVSELTVSDKNVANGLWFQSMWGLCEFSRGFAALEATNLSGTGASKMVIFHLI